MASDPSGEIIQCIIIGAMMGVIPIALQRHQKKIPEQFKVIRYSRSIIEILVYDYINIIGNFYSTKKPKI